jgi:hypothetical protein
MLKHPNKKTQKTYLQDLGENGENEGTLPSWKTSSDFFARAVTVVRFKESMKNLSTVVKMLNFIGI